MNYLVMWLMVLGCGLTLPPDYQIAVIANRGSEPLHILDTAGVRLISVPPCDKNVTSECALSVMLPRHYTAEYRWLHIVSSNTTVVKAVPAISLRDGNVLVFYPWGEPQWALLSETTTMLPGRIRHQRTAREQLHL